MPYIEMAVPWDVSESETLVTAHALPAEERPWSYWLQRFCNKVLVDHVVTPGEVSMGINEWLFKERAMSYGTSMIKTHGARPLRSQVKYNLC
jgi:hypothetical protein